MAQTSDVISSIAARYARLTDEQLFSITSDAVQRRQTAGEIRSMAASLLRQDQHKGLRGLIRRVKLLGNA